MEVMRNVEPEEKFLEKVRLLADKNGIVLIFDECTSGFRETFGGLHQKYAVTPDMAIFGKALVWLCDKRCNWKIRYNAGCR